ncbi:hypothetical protein [Paucibacter soli]|uniref:hypothetical protein n=1 Tax=Paucibacter soli TaxID=3133433 RepID=UPI0030B588C6
MTPPKLRCPACGKPSGVNILFGFPSPEAMDAAERGEIALGGCCLPCEPVHHRCLDCGHEWAAPEPEGGGQVASGRLQAR